MSDENSEKSRGKEPEALVDEAVVSLVETLPAPAEFAQRVIEQVPAAQAIRIYLKEIARFPVLSDSEELALVKEVQNNTDKNLRKKLNEASIRLVAWIAKEYAEGEAQLPDLINEGCLGLNEAIDSFDVTSGEPFRLHAAAAVRRSISRAVAYETSLSRVPDYLLEKISSVRPVSQRLMEELQREPTREEVAAELGLHIDELDRLIKLVGHADGKEQTEPEEEELPSQEDMDLYDDQDYD
ncbi:MAG: sigma-70 domain-containing protein [Candidatus Melainabacteria bacterium]|nr:sigma-70 domain-containing protein [Candidatus Melainabacteria bacterium]